VAYPIKGTPLYTEVEDRFIADLPWETSTDRDIDFRRTYRREYYDHAVTMIINEVNAFKAWHRNHWLVFSRLKARALTARFRMMLNR
jgi:hypothetical protein